MADKYFYDAFISYRHTDLDKFVAENLHKQMEAFRLPRHAAAKHSGKDRIRRVFRDKDELPLTNNLEDPIIKALHNSEYLIVICSPRLKESLWCKKEIDTFINVHGREKVFAVLIEGEPEESFPDALLYVEETVENPDGTVETVKKSMEPLAADVRGKNKRDMLKAMRTEILRLLAPMFSVSFDDLRQRHRERRMKRILAATALGALVCFLFGTVSTAMALRIQMQKEQLRAQSAEIQVQSEEIQKQSAEIQSQNSRLLEYQALNLAEESARKLAEGDRLGALETAYQALTEYEGIPMPYTAEAQLALTESLCVYDSGKSIKAMYQMETDGVIESMLCSSDKKTMVTYDYSGCITIWDIKTGDKIDKIYQNASSNGVVFLDNDRIAFIDRAVKIYSISEKAVTDTLDVKGPGQIYADYQGRYLLVKTWTGFCLYDAVSLEELFVYEPASEETKLGGFMFCRDGDFFIFLETPERGKEKLCFFDIASNTVTGSIQVPNYIINDVEYKDGTAYVLLNYRGEDLWDFKTLMLACNPETLEVKWKQVFEDCSASCLYRSYAKESDKLLLAATNELRIINEENGTEYVRFPLGSSVTGGASMGDKDRYIIFTRDGKYHYIDVESKMDYLMDYRFLCHSQNVKEIQIADGNFLILPLQDNKVTCYRYSQGGDLKENSDEFSIPETEVLSYSEAETYAKENGLPRIDLISYLFFDADESLAFVFYRDNTLDIYDTSDMSLKKSLSGFEEAITRYLGMDASGNLYLKGIGHGYMLNPDLELIGVIESLAAVEEGSSRLYIQPDGNSQYVVPIYTLEELLAKAEAIVIR